MLRKNTPKINRNSYSYLSQLPNSPINLSDYIKRNPPGMKERPKHPHSRADPDCEICNGFGWVQSEKYANNWFVCKYCAVENHKNFIDPPPKINYKRLGIIDELETNLTWDLIDRQISDGAKGLDAVKPAYEKGHGMVFLWGTYGQAKTLLGKILIATALRDGYAACYTNMNEALDDIRLAFDEQFMNTALVEKMKWWIDRDVLFIDELDKASKTDWAMDRIFQLLDHRYARALREEALTVIASNSKHDQLDGYLHSRLNDKRLGPIVHLHGIDGRLVMPKGWKY